MLLNGFEPSTHRIDRIVFGSGAPDGDSFKDIVKDRLPFNSVVVPVFEVAVNAMYSLDGTQWFDEFPFEECLEQWRSTEYEVIDGAMKFAIPIQSAKVLNIREIGFYGGDTLYAYRMRSNFVVPSATNASFVFNYHLKLPFVNSNNINLIAKVARERFSSRRNYVI